MKLGTLLLGATALATLCGTANAQIALSRHNFASTGWAGGEICKPCHIPHHGNPANGALWNHAMSSASYTLFEGGTGTSADFDARTRLCMGCHDGTVALDSFGGQNGTNFAPARVNLGTDLLNDHPVGSDAQYPPTPQPSWWSGSFRPESGFNSAIRLENWVDEGGVTHRVVGCTTCHGRVDHLHLHPSLQPELRGQRLRVLRHRCAQRGHALRQAWRPWRRSRMTGALRRSAPSAWRRAPSYIRHAQRDCRTRHSCRLKPLGARTCCAQARWNAPTCRWK